MRKIVTTLFAVFLASSALADDYHPHILKSQVVSLDVAAIERYAQSGTTFELNLGEISLKVTLSPAPVWPEEGLTVIEIGEDGSMKESVVHGNITYAGEVEGEDPEESEVRVGIARGVIEGYVMSETGWWWIEPLARFDPKAGADQYLVYATRDLEFELTFSPEDEFEDTEIKDDRVVIHDPRIRVSMFADREYVNRSGDSFPYFERHALLINQVNGIYKRETGREFKHQNSIADRNGVKLTSSWRLILMNQLVAHITNDFPSGLFSHIQHLTTGKNLEEDWLEALRGNSMGLTQQGFYRHTGSGSDAHYLIHQNLMMVAHVFGHHFNAFSSLADEWCHDTFLGFCIDYRRTLMWKKFYGDNQPRFSDGTLDPTHNNRQRVRDNMTQRGF